jgi:hypothetical protein
MRYMLEVENTDCLDKKPALPLSNRQPKLLDFSLTHRKHSTSQFLIDNFRAPLASRFSLTSNFRPPISSSSNRQSPELEIGLSYRKQRTDDFLIARFRHIIRSRTLGEPHHRMVAFLIGTRNEVNFLQLTENTSPISFLIGTISLLSRTDPIRRTFSNNARNSGGPGESRTPDTRFRKPLLYPSELQAPSNSPFTIAYHAIRANLFVKSPSIPTAVWYSIDLTRNRVADRKVWKSGPAFSEFHT